MILQLSIDPCFVSNASYRMKIHDFRVTKPYEINVITKVSRQLSVFFFIVDPQQF